MEPTNRIKISENFYLDEFFDKETYLNNNEETLKSWLDFEFIADLQKLRTNLQCGFTINNWFAGGIYQWRGLRNPKCKQYSKGSMHSQKPLKCVDFQCKIPALAVREHIKMNYHLYPRFRRLEKGVSWVHVDGKETNQKTILEFAA